MKITSLDKEIKKVFETGYYYIPRFQRPYSWEKEHVDEFWNDTIDDNELDYFIGSIVLYKKSDELYGIVDGQQRLTTITMVLCAIRDAFYDAGHENLARGVHSLIEKVDLNNDNQFILQTETSYPYFQEYIQKFEEPEVEIASTPEEANLRKAYDQINKRISDLIATVRSDKQLTKEKQDAEILRVLTSVRDKILKLKVIYIELEDEDDAYTIFEVLNTRGKDLKVGDLIKNHLTKHIKADNKNVDLPKDKWASIRGNIESTSRDLELDTFLLHVWLSKYEYTTSKSLFKKVKKEIGTAKAKKFLDDLVSDSILYANVFDVETRKWNKNEVDLKRSLSALSSFNVVQQTPMVLSLMREYHSGRLKFKYFKEGLQAIEHFHYIFNAVTSQRSSGSIASMYSLYARKLYGASDDAIRLKVIRDLIEQMRLKLPTREEFVAAFKTLKFTNDYTKQKRTIQYTLAKIDEQYNDSGVVIDYDAMTLEHIMAQRPNSKVRHLNDSYGQIGNIILMDSATNSNKLGNKSFALKKPVIIESGVFVDEIIQEAQDWTQQIIEARTAYLAMLAYDEVFKI